MERETAFPMRNKSILAVFAIILVPLAYFCCYIVKETEQVVLTQFGRILGEPIKDPGLNFKLPWQQANYMPKNLLQWDGNPDQINTKDKTYIWVDTFARWKIVDPVKFLRTVGATGSSKEQSEIKGNRKLNDIIDPAVRNAITSNPLIEAVRRSARQLKFYDKLFFGESTEATDAAAASQFVIEKGRARITQDIMEQSQPKLTEFGIELVDVKIKRINYEDQVRDSVYQRMIAERKQIAEKFRSEGKGQANRILGEKEWKLKQIRSQAYERSQEIMGQADAEAISIYAKAFGMDPEFYSFITTLEIYSKAFEENTSLVLSTDSDFLKYLKRYAPPAQ